MYVSIGNRNMLRRKVQAWMVSLRDRLPFHLLTHHLFCLPCTWSGADSTYTPGSATPSEVDDEELRVSLEEVSAVYCFYTFYAHLFSYLWCASEVFLPKICDQLNAWYWYSYSLLSGLDVGWIWRLGCWWHKRKRGIVRKAGEGQWRRGWSSSKACWCVRETAGNIGMLF